VSSILYKISAIANKLLWQYGKFVKKYAQNAIQTNIYVFLDKDFIHYKFLHCGDATGFFARRGHFILAHRNSL